jgi:predicted nucleic acid-binding Zn ribbon protein
MFSPYHGSFADRHVLRLHFRPILTYSSFSFVHHADNLALQSVVMTASTTGEILHRHQKRRSRRRMLTSWVESLPLYWVSLVSTVLSWVITNNNAMHDTVYSLKCVGCKASKTFYSHGDLRTRPQRFSRQSAMRMGCQHIVNLPPIAACDRLSKLRRGKTAVRILGLLVLTVIAFAMYHHNRLSIHDQGVHSNYLKSIHGSIQPAYRPFVRSHSS